MNAGKLNKRIQIQAPSGQQDDSGQPVGWTTIHTCWASIDVVTSQLVYETAQFISNVTHRITIRDPKEPLISSTCRVVYGSHTYEIKAVLNPHQDNRELQLICYELQSTE